jgi:hypothetical protein
MKFFEYVNQYVTYENAKEYAGITDKIAFVSDITGLSVNNRFVPALENFLDNYLSLGIEVAHFCQQTKVGSAPANFFL